METIEALDNPGHSSRSVSHTVQDSNNPCPALFTENCFALQPPKYIPLIWNVQNCPRVIPILIENVSDNLKSTSLTSHTVSTMLYIITIISLLSCLRLRSVILYYYV